MDSGYDSVNNGTKSPTNEKTPTTTTQVVLIELDPVSKSFGFTAGSQQPVVIRNVDEDGPSWGKLRQYDELVQIDGQPVEDASLAEVVSILKSHGDCVAITVRRYNNNNHQHHQGRGGSGRTSKNMSNGQKKPGSKRVRFVDDIVAGLVPDVLKPSLVRQVSEEAVKIYLENGQMKTYSYKDRDDVTVEDVVNSIREKLQLNSTNFGLILQSTSRSSDFRKVAYLSKDLSLIEVADRIRQMSLHDYGFSDVRCWFRYVYIPASIGDIYRDKASLDYLYQQCCNDVKGEKYATELNCETVLNLASLMMLQLAVDDDFLSHRSSTIVDHIEKKWGLDHFLPASILETVKRKTLIKRLVVYLGKNRDALLTVTVPTPGNGSSHRQYQQQQQQPRHPQESKNTESTTGLRLTGHAVKLRYISRLTNMHDFGGLYFNASLSDLTANANVFVGPFNGIEYVIDTMRSKLVNICDLLRIRMTPYGPHAGSNSLVRFELLALQEAGSQTQDTYDTQIILVDADQADEFVSFVSGYYVTLTDRRLDVVRSDHRGSTSCNYENENTTSMRPEINGVHLAENRRSSSNTTLDKQLALLTKHSELDDVTCSPDVHGSSTARQLPPPYYNQTSISSTSECSTPDAISPRDLAGLFPLITSDDIDLDQSESYEFEAETGSSIQVQRILWPAIPPLDVTFFCGEEKSSSRQCGQFLQGETDTAEADNTAIDLTLILPPDDDVIDSDDSCCAIAYAEDGESKVWTADCDTINPPEQFAPAENNKDLTMEYKSRDLRMEPIAQQSLTPLSESSDQLQLTTMTKLCSLIEPDTRPVLSDAVLDENDNEQVGDGSENLELCDVTLSFERDIVQTSSLETSDLHSWLTDCSCDRAENLTVKENDTAADDSESAYDYVSDDCGSPEAAGNSSSGISSRNSSVDLDPPPPPLPTIPPPPYIKAPWWSSSKA